MTKAQTNLGVIGAVICAGLALNMTDSGQGAIVGGIGGFALGSMLPRILDLTKALLVIGLALGIAVLAFWGRLPALPEEGYLYLTNACPQPINVHLWWRDADGEWGGAGPWGFSGNSARVMAFSEGDKLVMTSGTIYYHAVSRDGQITWDGENMRQIDGLSFPMRRSDAGKPKDGRYSLSLTCH